MIRQSVPSQLRGVGPRSVEAILTTGALARDGHILVPQGAKLAGYRANPVVLWQHDPNSPVARAEGLTVYPDRIAARCQGHPEIANGMTGGGLSRDKGLRVERELVRLHAGLGVKAERVPLSGAVKYRENGADVDVYAFGPDSAPLVCEVKARASGEGFATLERWLGDADGLFLRRDRADPLAVLPWRTWTRLIARIAGDARHSRRASQDAVLPEPPPPRWQARTPIHGHPHCPKSAPW